MGPIVAQLATDYDGRVTVGMVDVTTQGGLVRTYAVTATPTFVYFKDGREVGRQVGQTTYADLAAHLQALLAP
jgi:thioredoxin 1